MRIAGILLAGALSGAASAHEVSLEYCRYPNSLREATDLTLRSRVALEPLASAPEGTRRLPPLVSEQPVFAVASIGESRFLLIFDRMDARDPFYSVMYCDANSNGDLTDDVAVGDVDEGQQSGSFESNPLDVTVELKGKTLPYSFRGHVSCTAYATGAPPRRIDLADLSVELSGNCCYLGRLELGGRSYRLLLEDANVNGRFDDRVVWGRGTRPEDREVLQGRGDALFLTEYARFDFHDRSFVPGLVMLRDNLFLLGIDIGAKRLTLTPFDGTVSRVSVAMPVERLFLDARDGVDILAYEPGVQISIPDGAYRVASYQALRKDVQGDHWRLAAAATVRTPFMHLGRDGVRRIELGEPYKAQIQALAELRRGEGQQEALAVLLSLELCGSAREKVLEVSHVSGQRTRLSLDSTRARPEPPSYTITTANGEVVTRGSFEYG
ncbi:MAG: hypothetical protein AB1486_18220 [Planctomycetota bacterium]